MKRFTPLQLFLVVVMGVVIPVLFVAGFYYLHVTFPEEARVENLTSKYAQLVEDLDEAMASSNSSTSLANELKRINYPADTLAVFIQDWSRVRQKPANRKRTKSKMTKEIIIFDNRIIDDDVGVLSDFSSMSNGGGYGAKDGQHYWILHHRVDKYGYDFIKLLFEREMPETEQ